MKERESLQQNYSNLSNLADKKVHQINNNVSEENKELIKDKKKDNIEEFDKKGKVEIMKKNKKLRCDKKGYTYIFLVDNENNPLITIGPHWIMFLIFFSFITGGFSFLFVYYWNFLNSFLLIMGILAYLIFCYVYIFILITDPGIPKSINNDMANKSITQYLYCEFCDNYVTIESKTKHCLECNICIEGYDHHCSWTSKCIGKKNLYYFYFLIFWLVIIIIYYIFAFIIAHDNWYYYKKSQLKLLKMKNKKPNFKH